MINDGNVRKSVTKFGISAHIFSIEFDRHMKLNPISTEGGFFHPPICFLPVTFLFLSQFPQIWYLSQN